MRSIGFKVSANMENRFSGRGNLRLVNRLAPCFILLWIYTSINIELYIAFNNIFFLLFNRHSLQSCEYIIHVFEFFTHAWWWRWRGWLTIRLYLPVYLTIILALNRDGRCNLALISCLSINYHWLLFSFINMFFC